MAEKLGIFVSSNKNLRHVIEITKALFLMPSRFEPSGLTQMISMRYATPPIARRTGGLAESIADEAQSPGAGTGFLFEAPTTRALVAACRAALRVRGDEASATWSALVARAMATHFGWEAEAAARYLEVYSRAVDLRREAIG